MFVLSILFFKWCTL